jgi:hypothetical protein
MRASPIAPQLLPTNPRNGRQVVETRVMLRGLGGANSDGFGGGGGHLDDGLGEAARHPPRQPQLQRRGRLRRQQ